MTTVEPTETPSPAGLGLPPLPAGESGRVARGDGDLRDGDRGPPRFQYSLQSLLALTTLACLVFAAVAQLSAVWSAVFLWALLLVAAHVVANALGTRAAARTSRRIASGLDAADDSTHIDTRSATAPTTRLGGNAGLGLSLFVLIGCGAVVGSVVGTLLVWIHNHRQVGVSGIVLACVSSAGIGAFLTFLTASCLRATGKAWREAAERK